MIGTGSAERGSLIGQRKQSELPRPRVVVVELSVSVVELCTSVVELLASVDELRLLLSCVHLLLSCVRLLLSCVRLLLSCAYRVGHIQRLLKILSTTCSSWSLVSES